MDVEDWFHPELVRRHVGEGDTRSVVREGTTALLDLMRRHGARGTFFVLGDVAVRHPDLVRRIAEDGHEIASHGMTHTPLWDLDEGSFRAELRAYRDAIRRALGRDDTIGFRAPTFSLDHSTSWALRVLAEEGFRYDSSVFPRRVKLYGVSGAPLEIYRPSLTDLARHDPRGPLVEFPVALTSFAGLRVPVAGGFYLRVLPAGWLTAQLERIARQRSVVLYMHPWECATDLPRVTLPGTDAFITYGGIRSVLPKLDRILSRLGSRPMREILERGGHLEPAAA